MHKLLDYVCEELEELEHKVDKEGKLSATEMQYMDMLAHTKKNLLKSEEMYEDSEYSSAMRPYMRDGRSYARDGRSYARRRDSMGRYSREGYSMNDDMVERLRDLMRDAPDERTRSEIQRLVTKMEQM